MLARPTSVEPPSSAQRWIALRCERCDVTWRGLPQTPCWTCGRSGVAAANVTVVSD